MSELLYAGDCKTKRDRALENEAFISNHCFVLRSALIEIMGKLCHDYYSMHPDICAAHNRWIEIMEKINDNRGRISELEEKELEFINSHESENKWFSFHYRINDLKDEMFEAISEFIHNEILNNNENQSKENK